MKRLKEIITLLCPPIVIHLYMWLKNGMENRALKPFSGVYYSVDEIHDENPWIQNEWIEVSKYKLKRYAGSVSDSFLPSEDFGGYFVLPCLIINLLSQNKPINIIDFGGGTGLIYFIIYPYLLNPENVTYHVVDRSSELIEIGRKHAMSMKNGKIVFHTEIPQKCNMRLDILYLNTTLQYIYDYPSVLDMLLQYKPTYVILTRLIAGDMKTYITCQRVFEYTTPCIFVNFVELVEIFSRNGFKLILKSPCSDEVYERSYDDSIPKHLRIHNTANLIFKRFD